nr:endonuclease NucS domain-containing protein [Geobacter anodireducens]
MPIRHAIWKVGTKPEPLAEVSLGKEALLEQMITEDPTILSDRWLLIGRQVRTTHGGFIDLLALNQDGQLIVIELKRDMTPREVVAQALDYASWVQELKADDVASIYSRFSGGGSLGDIFRQRARDYESASKPNPHTDRTNSLAYLWMRNSSTALIKLLLLHRHWT